MFIGLAVGCAPTIEEPSVGDEPAASTLSVEAVSTYMRRLESFGLSGALLIAESGLHNHADLVRLATAGARGFLVGESLMRKEDVRLATRRLLGLEEDQAA